MPVAEVPRLHLPAGSATDGSDPVLVTPALAGWAFSGLRVMRLAAGASRAIDTGPNEMVVLPLADCLRHGNAAAAVVVSRVSCSDAMPYPHEVEAMLARG